MTQANGEPSERYGQIVAEAWADPAFKRRLLADPAAVLRERGIELPAGMQVRVVEDTDQFTNLVLPAMPGGEAVHRAARPGHGRHIW